MGPVTQYLLANSSLLQENEMDVLILINFF